METLTLVEKQINRFKQQFLQLNQAGMGVIKSAGILTQHYAAIAVF